MILVQGMTKASGLQEGYTTVTYKINFVIFTYNKYIYNEIYYFSDDFVFVVSLSVLDYFKLSWIQRYPIAKH